MNKDRNWLRLGVIVLVFLALPMAVYMVATPGKTNLGIRAGQAEEVFLFLMPTFVEGKVGDELEIEVKLDTGEEVIGGGEVRVEYDQSLLKLKGEVEAGPAFPSVEGESGIGQVTLRFDDEITGQGTVAILTFEARAEGEGKVEISQASAIFNQADEGNLLRNTAGTKVVVE